MQGSHFKTFYHHLKTKHFAALTLRMLFLRFSSLVACTKHKLSNNKIPNTTSNECAAWLKSSLGIVHIHRPLPLTITRTYRNYFHLEFKYIRPMPHIYCINCIIFYLCLISFYNIFSSSVKICMPLNWLIKKNIARASCRNNEKTTKFV